VDLGSKGWGVVVLVLGVEQVAAVTVFLKYFYDGSDRDHSDLSVLYLASIGWSLSHRVKTVEHTKAKVVV